MISIFSTAAVLAVAVAPLVQGQTFSACNPTQKTGCPANPGLNEETYTVDFSQGVPSEWKLTNGNVTTGPNGAEFSIRALTDGPTMQSNFYIFYGSVEAVVQAAPGQGIVSSFILESDDLDEIDWEIIGSQTNQAQSNYFGKGNTTTYDRGQFHPVTSPQTSLRTYAVDWKPDTTTWSIDGQVVRTLNFADAVGGKNYPQTPMNIRLGNWVAGQPSNNQGTIQWAGGLADMNKAPFNMIVKSVTVKSYNPATSYSYGDQSGSSGSIKVEKGTNNAAVSTSRSNSGNVRASSIETSRETIRGSRTTSRATNLATNVASVITIVPSGRGSTPTTGIRASGNGQTVTVNVQGAAATGTGAGVPMGLASTITVNVGGSRGSSTMATFGLGSTTGVRPAQVTTNDAPRQAKQPILAMSVVLLLTLFWF